MNMRVAIEISAKVIEEKGEVEVPTSEIVVSGKSTGKFVSGAVLEAAVQCDERYLLFFTDDVPFEEMLSIHLLDNQWHFLDSARIGGIYTTGTFSALKLCEPNLVHFRFIGDTDWVVEILSRPMFRLPFVSDPPGVYRAFGFSLHFLARENPHRKTP